VVWDLTTHRDTEQIIRVYTPDAFDGSGRLSSAKQYLRCDVQRTYGLALVTIATGQIKSTINNARKSCVAMAHADERRLKSYKPQDRGNDMKCGQTVRILFPRGNWNDSVIKSIITLFTVGPELFT